MLPRRLVGLPIKSILDAALMEGSVCEDLNNTFGQQPEGSRRRWCYDSAFPVFTQIATARLTVPVNHLDIQGFGGEAFRTVAQFHWYR